MTDYRKQFREPIKRINDILVKADAERREKTAFIYRENGEEKKKTFGEFYRDVISLGSALATLGCTEGHIACIGENSYKWVNVYLTALTSNGVFCPVDKELPEGDIINVLDCSGAEVVFFSKKFAEFFRKNREKLPNVKYFIGFSEKESDGVFLSFDKLIVRGDELYSAGYTKFFADMGKGDTDTLKMLVFTSGTTGNSKGVMLTEKNLSSVTYWGFAASRVYDAGLSVLPYHHTYEAAVGLLVYLYYGSVTVINDSFSSILKNFKKYRPCHVYLVPAFAEMFRRMILSGLEKQGELEKFKAAVEKSNRLRRAGIDLRPVLFKSVRLVFGGKLKKIVCGGAPLRAETAKFFDDIGIFICNGYGITECSPLVAVNRDDDTNDPATVGFPIGCVTVKIDSPSEDGTGEICVRGDTVMLGYYNAPEETARVLNDGWFCTGDLGYFNEKGMLVITGRKKNVIVLDNGKNIYPEELEDRIMSVPYVQEVIVRQDTDEGNRSVLAAEVFLAAEAVKRRGADITEEILLSDIRNAFGDLPVYKQITKVIIRKTEFDKTSSNKIKR